MKYVDHYAKNRNFVAQKILKTPFMKKFILSAIGAALVAFSANATDYNIKKYGAVSDTTKYSTKAIQRAIDACSNAGGGRVVVPAGSYKIGSIVLKSNVNLHLELGATLYGSTNIADYTPFGTDFKSLRTQGTTVQLIYGDKVENVVIDGYGTIDGRGRNFATNRGHDEGITRPHLLRFVQSKNIVVRDITIRNSPCWMQHYLACDHVRIEGVTVFNRNHFNNDGLDLDGCHDVIVSNCFIDSDDDGIVLKSTSPRLCENIIISNCVISSHCNAVKMGTETTGGFRNININNIVIMPSSDQKEKFCGQWTGISAIALEIVDGGVMENINLSNFTVEGTQAPIYIRLANRARPYLAGIEAPGVGSIRNVRISNFTARNTGVYGSSITAIPGYYVEDVVLENISIHHKGGVTADKVSDRWKDEREKKYPEGTSWHILPSQGFFIRHARNIELSNIRITSDEADERPEFIEIDTHNVSITKK